MPSRSCPGQPPSRTRPKTVSKRRRIVLKLSGEALLGDEPGDNFSVASLQHLVAEVRSAQELGVEMAMIFGGGNIVRGSAYSKSSGTSRVQGDYMGMLATVINAMAMQGALQAAGIETRLHTAVEMDQLAQLYIRQKAISALNKGRIVLFAGGSGNPFFTTDTAAALRASEIGADLLLKGTKVAGVYTKDPIKNPDSDLIEHASFDQVIRDKFEVMDATAITMCRAQNIPIHVFDIFKAGNLRKLLAGEKIGTRID